MIDKIRDMFDAKLIVNQNECIGCGICVKVCPVKAISWQEKNNKKVTYIDNDKCINCGRCYIPCPKKCISFPTDFFYVNRLLENKEKVYLLLAPSFIIHYGNDIKSLLKIWRSCGFDLISEITYGAKLVTKEYAKLVEKNNMERIIVTTCPVIYSYVHIYEPHNIDYLAPIVSPMIAMAKAVKNKFPDHKIVFVGPCPAKIFEARKYNEIDAALTFREFDELVINKKDSVFVDETKQCIEFNNFYSYKNKIYPLSGGLSNIMIEKNMISKNKVIIRDGVTSIHDLFENKEIPKEINFFDVLFCEGGCINGPGIKAKSSIEERKDMINNYREDSEKIDSEKIKHMDAPQDIDMTPFFKK